MSMKRIVRGDPDESLHCGLARVIHALKCAFFKLILNSYFLILGDNFYWLRPPTYSFVIDGLFNSKFLCVTISISVFLPVKRERFFRSILPPVEKTLSDDTIWKRPSIPEIIYFRFCATTLQDWHARPFLMSRRYILSWFIENTLESCFLCIILRRWSSFKLPLTSCLLSRRDSYSQIIPLCASGWGYFSSNVSCAADRFLILFSCEKNF